MRRMTGWMRALAVAGALAGFQVQAKAAENAELRISRQPSILYIQTVLMEDGKLIEKHAAALGLPNLQVRFLTLTSGGVSVDSLLANQLDVVTSGVTNMLLAWGKTNGQAKSIGALVGMPLILVTRNPDVKSIKDFGPTDRIAVPTLKVSQQATILGMALEKMYGPGGNSKLDSNQVQLGHPDATAAVLNPKHEVNSHFSAPPFYTVALKAPGVHAVLNSNDVLGGPATITCAFALQSFVDANPIKTKAFIAALDEANAIIAKDPKRAAETYLAATKEKVSVDELVTMLTDKGSILSAAPHHTIVYAEYMQRIGLFKPKAASWKDYFIPALHGRDGS